MPKGLNTEERLLRKRKFYVRSLVIFTVLMLLAFNLGSWLFVNRMGSYLEQELEKRLIAVAGLAVNKIEMDYIEDILSSDENRLGQQLLQDYLNNLLYNHEFESAFIIDHEYLVLIDGGDRFPRGQKRTYIKQDSTALERAWADTIATSPMHILEGNKFKSVYAPITDDLFEVQALLVLEASADFFELLKLFQQGLIFGGLISFGLIIVFSFFISWMLTLLIRTHESLQQSEKLAAMGRMAASMAHEIRNPLGIIKGTADVLKEKYGAKEQSDEMFDFIAAEVQRLNYLINNFLSFAREPKLNLKTGDIKLVVEKTIAAVEREEHDFEIEIATHFKNELPQFKFDENTIQQVLFNLMINAYQAFNKNGKIEVSLNTIYLKNKKYAKISVADNGPGIEGDTSKIFEPFFTTKSTGSGLGLTICKQIIEKHGGWIEVTSEIGNGTTFMFFLLL